MGTRSSPTPSRKGRASSSSIARTRARSPRWTSSSSTIRSPRRGRSRADVAREKGAIYAALARDGVAVVNADDAAAAGQVARSEALRDETFGRAAGVRYRLVERIARAEAGSRLVITRGRERFELDFP